MKKYGKIGSILVHLSYIFFFICCFILSRQVPFNNFSGIMNFALIGFVICSFVAARINRVPYISVVLWFSICILLIISYYSLFLGNEPSLIIRFLIILTLICIVYHINPDVNYFYIAIACFYIQALVVIVFQVLLSYFFSPEYATSIRNIYISNGWGDVYNYGYGLWNIQLKGNALLPFFCFVSYVVFEGKKRLFITSTFAIATVFSGNFAFVLGFIAFFLLYSLIKINFSINRLRIFIFSFFSILVLGFEPASRYLEKVIEQKSGYSGQHRVEQTLALIGDLSNSYFSVLFGRGLGNVDVSGFGFEYHNVIYFELQTLYILNQMGFLFFSAFIILNVIFTIKYIKEPVLCAMYIAYLVYSFWNPYVFDTNHIVVIAVLISLPDLIRDKKRKP